MQKTSGPIITTENGVTDEKILMTYSEQEKQENEINRENAKLVYQPAFIPFFPNIQKKNNLTDTETKLYGYIWFFLSNEGRRFYFTNEQLATILNCGPHAIKTSIKKLSASGLIETSYKVRAGGGTVRFISRLGQKTPSDGTFSPSQTVRFHPANYIKDKSILKKNYIDSDQSIFDTKEFKEELIQQFPLVDIPDEIIQMKDWLLSTGRKYKDYRAFARNWCRRAFIKNKPNGGKEIRHI